MSDESDLARLWALRAEDFRPHLRSEFRIAAGGEPVVLRLAEVYAYPSQPGAPRELPFGIVFAGPHGLDQRIHRLEHAEMGDLDLFLVPIRPAPDGSARYEAVFN